MSSPSARERVRRTRGTPAASPRVRDLPAPRETEGVIAPLLRGVFAWPYRVVLAGFYRARIRPWQLTFLSLVANVVVGALLVRGDRLIPGLLLIVAGLFDIFDGAVARLRNEDGPLGAFLDSVVDRISDIILFGCLFWSEAGQGHRLSAILSLTSLSVSLLVSYIRAEAESAGLTLTEGLMQRFERYVALIIGLVAPGALLPILVLLTGLGGLTALQRAGLAWLQLAEGPDSGPSRGRRGRVTRTGIGS